MGRVTFQDGLWADVGPEWDRLSPEQQAVQGNEIHKHILASKAPAPPPDRDLADTNKGIGYGFQKAGEAVSSALADAAGGLGFTGAQKSLQDEATASGERAKATGYQPMELNEVHGPLSLANYALHKGAENVPLLAAAANPAMAAVPLAGGLASAEMNEHLKEVAPDMSTGKRWEIAAPVGVVQGALQLTGLGPIFKGMSAPVLEKLGVQAVTRIIEQRAGPLAARAFQGALTRVGNVAVAGGSNAAIGAGNEQLTMGAEALAGKTPTFDDWWKRSLEAGESGGAMGAGGSLIHGAAGATKDAVVTTGRGAARLGQDVITRTQYPANEDPRRLRSGVRTGTEMEREQASIAAANGGTTPNRNAPARNLQGEYYTRLNNIINRLHQNGDISDEVRQQFLDRRDGIINNAGRGTHETTQDDYNFIDNQGFSPSDTQGLKDAFRDLNSFTNASRANRNSGPVRETMAAVAPAVAQLAGHMLTPGIGGWAAGTIARPSVVSGMGAMGGLVDRVLGFQGPEIMRRLESRRRVAQERGIDPGDSRAFMGDMEQRLEAARTNRQQVAQGEAAQRVQANRAMRQLRRQRNDPGLGGWDHEVYSRTGLRPNEVDRGLNLLEQRSSITPEENRAFRETSEDLGRNGSRRGLDIQDQLNDLATHGELTRSPEWLRQNPNHPSLHGSGVVRNPLAYQASIANAHSARDVVASMAPSEELATAAHEVADISSRDGRNARIDEALRDHPQHASWIEGVLRSLNRFGQDSGGGLDLARTGEVVKKGLDAFDRARGFGVVPGGGVERTTKEVEAYNKAAGIKSPPLPKGGLPMPETYLHKIADWMQNAKHDPNNPVVKRAYNALATETEAQFAHLVKSGNVKYETWHGDGEPYRNSAEMLKDVRDNGHLWFYKTTPETFGEKGQDNTGHPLLNETKYRDQNGTPLQVNDLFRIVHDYYGHSDHGFSFGEKGEYNAFNAHARMFSKEAIPALAAETLAQNAWVNFGPHLRNAEGKVPGPGEPGYRGRPDRPFAPQKSAVVPEGLLRQDPNPESAARFDAGSMADIAKRAIAEDAIPLTKEELQISTIPALHTKTLGRNDQEQTIFDLATTQDRLHNELHGDMKALTPENRTKVARIMANEVLHALTKPGNGAEWYGDNITDAHATAALMHPEILDDRYMRTAFNYILAATSNGLEVSKNADLQDRIYRKFKRSGKMPTNMGEGKSAPAMMHALDLWNKMVKEFGKDDWLDMLTKDMSVKEIKNQFGYKVARELQTEVLPVSAIIGPKIGGGFFQNLMGNWNPLTMDRWWSRTWGRLTGQMLDVTTEEARVPQRQRLRAALAQDPAILSDHGLEVQDPMKMSDADVMHAAKVIWSRDRSNHFAKQDGTKERTEHHQAAQRLHEGTIETRIDPGSGKERRFQRETAREAMDMLKALGIHLHPAQFQALLWFPEKDFFEHQGVATSPPNDYAKAYREIAKKHGKTDKQIDAAVEARRPGATRKGRPDVGGVDNVTDAQAKSASSKKSEGVLRQAPEGEDQNIPF
jgi:hypothetical protein